MLHMIPVSPEVNLNGSFFMLKVCYRIDCRNVTTSKSLTHLLSFSFFFFD